MGEQVLDPAHLEGHCSDVLDGDGIRADGRSVARHDLWRNCLADAHGWASARGIGGSANLDLGRFARTGLSAPRLDPRFVAVVACLGQSGMLAAAYSRVLALENAGLDAGIDAQSRSQSQSARDQRDCQGHKGDGHQEGRPAFTGEWSSHFSILR